jgi:hypothetical protein
MTTVTIDHRGDSKMTLRLANLIAGSIGHPSKMPGTSYGISAHDCITGSKLAQVPGSVCYGCYALGGNYQYPSVMTAHAKRQAGLSHPRWAEAMAYLIWHSEDTWHRWHDSGDLQGVWHLDAIARVADATPWVHHWLPTRELKIVQDYVKGGGVIPRNLLIRVSATMVDGRATTAWPYTSEVHSADKPHESAQDCPARFQGNKCGDCRACWSHDVAKVSYHEH